MEPISLPQNHCLVHKKRFRKNQENTTGKGVIRFYPGPTWIHVELQRLPIGRGPISENEVAAQHIPTRPRAESNPRNMHGDRKQTRNVIQTFFRRSHKYRALQLGSSLKTTFISKAWILITPQQASIFQHLQTKAILRISGELSFYPPFSKLSTRSGN